MAKTEVAVAVVVVAVEADADAVVVVQVVLKDLTGIAPQAKRERRIFFKCEAADCLMIISDSEKKIHQGWGGDEGSTELKVEEEGAQDASAEAPAADWDGAAANDDAWGSAPAADAGGEETKESAAPAAEARVEEEDNTMTLDEYLAQRKENALASVPQLEARKANDGDDTFEGATLITKEEEEDYFAGRVITFLYKK